MSAEASPRARGGVRIWAALALPPVAWFLFEQGLGQTVRLACASGGPPVGPLVGLGALLVCAVAAGLAWSPAHGSGHAHEARRFVARLALGEAGLFGLAILFQTLATLIVQPCVS